MTQDDLEKIKDILDIAIQVRNDGVLYIDMEEIIHNLGLEGYKIVKDGVE